MEKPGNKEKSIAMLVTVIVILTICLFVAIGLLIWKFNESDSTFSEPEQKPLLCGNASDPSNGMTALYADGKKLFKEKCSSCHMLTERNTTGPGFKGVRERVPGGKWIYAFIRNEDSLISIGDPYTIMIREQYPSNNFKHAFKTLSDEEIDEVFAYH